MPTRRARACCSSGSVRLLGFQAIAQPSSPTPCRCWRAPRGSRLHQRLERIGTSTGNSVISRGGDPRCRGSPANRGVAILIDQHLHSPDVVYVDYFGRPAATTSALAALALEPAHRWFPFRPAAARRTIPLRLRASRGPAVLRVRRRRDAVHQRCTDVLEMYVRRHPELWLWMHRRWRGPVPALAEDGCSWTKMPSRLSRGGC